MAGPFYTRDQLVFSELITHCPTTASSLCPDRASRDILSDLGGAGGGPSKAQRLAQASGKALRCCWYGLVAVVHGWPRAQLGISIETMVIAVGARVEAAAPGGAARAAPETGGGARARRNELQKEPNLALGLLARHHGTSH